MARNDARPTTTGIRSRIRLILGLTALSLAPWGAALFAFSGAAVQVHADTPARFQDEHITLAVQNGGQQFFVSIEMLLQQKPGEDFEVATRRAKDAVLARFPGAVEVNDEGVGAQFVTNSYWWPTHGTSWRYNAAGKPAGLTGDSAAVAGGATSWGGVGADFAFTNAGTTAAGTGGCGGSTDGNNTVGWSAQAGSVLAVTCSWYSTGSNPYTAVEFDMEIDPGWTWTTGSSGINMDLQSVATHEFGHAAGLGHSALSSAVMYASYMQGTNKRTLTADDIGGITAIYGAGGAAPTNTPTNTPVPPTNTPAPTNTPTSVPTATPTKTPVATPTNTAVSTPTSAPPPPPTSTPTNTPTAPAQATNTPTKTVAAATSTPTKTPTKTPTPRPGRGRLTKGPNLVTWSGAPQSPAIALANSTASVQVIYGFDRASGVWLRYGPELPPFLNTLTTLQEGQAYWFMTSNAGELILP